MTRRSGWLWLALLLPAYLAYQAFVHAVIVDRHTALISLALASLPLLALAYWAARYAHSKMLWAVLIVVAGALVVIAEQRDQLGLPLASGVTHAAMNLAMLWVFGRTLLRGREPLITGFARRIHGTLPPHMELYTRRVTIAWCVFFSAQVLLSAVLFALSLNYWSLFVNVLSLPLVALMFVVEYAYRIIRYRDFPHASIWQGIQAFAQDMRLPAVPESVRRTHG
jgi:uncharacterized membrane protein